jgi:hypothetical protein
MIHSLKPNANTISQFELSGKEINWIKGELIRINNNQI